MSRQIKRLKKLKSREAQLLASSAPAGWIGALEIGYLPGCLRRSVFPYGFARNTLSVGCSI